MLTVVEPGLGERRGTRTEAKRRIAAAALALLPGTSGSVILDGGSTTAALAELLPAPSGSVILDGGSTTAALAELLPADRSLVVAANSVPISARLASSPGMT